MRSVDFWKNFLFGCIWLTAIAVYATDSDFPQFRGPAGRAALDDQDIPLSWSESEGIAWKFEELGSGWSQPIVIGDRIFVTSAVADEPLIPKNFADGVKTPQSMGMSFFSGAPKFEVQWLVRCIDLQSGSLLWKTEIDSGIPEFPIHPSNTYATETPVADATRLFVYFGATGRVAALSHDGEILWTRDFEAQQTSNKFGTGSSLAIHEGNVFVQNFGQESAELLCLDGQSGETVWKATREKAETSWSSPIIWTNELRSELISSGGNRVVSYDPATGDQLWTVSNVKAATACSVAMDANHIYFGGSDPFSTGPLFAVMAGGTGDLSPPKNNAQFEYCRWMTKKAAPGMASPVSTGSFVYVPDKNILRCYRADSGELVYQKRLPDLKMVNASPLVIGDNLLLIGEEGRAVVIKTGENFKIVGSGQIEDTVWATPAVSSGRILIRGLDTLYCIAKP